MDEQPLSEVLPGLYRAVLDAVADLEVRGKRHEAARIRADATRIYSKAWNATAARRLGVLRLRADRIVESRRRARYDAVLETLGRNVDLKRTTV